MLFLGTTSANAVTLEAGVNPGEAMSAPEIVTGIRAEGGSPIVLTGARIEMPDGWKARNPGAVRNCSQADFQARRCAENTRIGSISSQAIIGPVEADADGGAYLLESDADNEPIKIGFLVTADLNGVPFPIPPFGADITLEPVDGSVSDRIIITFVNPPAIPVLSFIITLDGGEKGLIGTGPFDHILGDQQCGEKVFDGVVSVRGEGDQVVSDSVNINRNCNPFVVTDAIGRGQQSPIRPRLSVRSALAEHSDVTFEVDGRINDGARGYHSVKVASLNFPVSSDVNLNAVARCPNNAGANCPAGSDVGSTSMVVAAAGQSHNVEGNVYLTNGGLRLTYTNTPVRLNNRAPIVIDATLEQVRGRYRITVGDHSDANAAGFPTVYEIKRWSLTLDGDAGGNFLTHDRAKCEEDESDPQERYRGFGNRRGAFTSSFSTDYGLPYWPLSVRCSELGRQKSKPITGKPIDSKSSDSKSGSSKSDGSKSEKSKSSSSKSQGKASRTKSKAGKTRTVAFRK